MSYITKVQGYSPIAYWPLNEPSGNDAFDQSGNGYDGTYTGVTLGQTGIGDGETSPLFDGANDRVDIYSIGLRDAFNKAEGTVLIWSKVFNSGVWTDGDERHMFTLYTDNNNFVSTHKLTNNNFTQQRYKANSTQNAKSRTPFSPTDWVSYVITWSVTGDVVKFYYDGGNEATSGTLGVWVGNLASAWLGRWGTFFGFWYGYLAHCAIWDSALAPATIADLAVVAEDYILTADQGSYTLFGQTANLLADRLIAAAQGSYTLTGQNVNLLFGRKLAAAQGSYTLTGQAANLLFGRKLAAAQGSYTLTGQAVNLLVDRILTANQGTYTLTDQSANLLFGHLLTAAQGSYTLTGQAAALKAARLLTAVTGSYVLSGQSVTLIYAISTPTDASRIYVIAAEDRIYVIALEDRTYVIPA